MKVTNPIPILITYFQKEKVKKKNLGIFFIFYYYYSSWKDDGVFGGFSFITRATRNEISTCRLWRYLASVDYEVHSGHFGKLPAARANNYFSLGC